MATPIKERIDCGRLVEEVDLSTLPGWDALKAQIKAEALREAATWIEGVDLDGYEHAASDALDDRASELN